MKKTIALIASLLLTISAAMANSELKTITSSKNEDQFIEVHIDELEGEPNMVLLSAEFNDIDETKVVNIVTTQEELQNRIANRLASKASRNAVITGLAAGSLPLLSAAFFKGSMESSSLTRAIFRIPGLGQIANYGSLLFMAPSIIVGGMVKPEISTAASAVTLTATSVILGGVSASIAYNLTKNSDEAARSVKVLIDDEYSSIETDVDLKTVFQKIELLAK